MDLSRIPRRRYTPFVTPLEFLPNFSRALAQSCPGGKGPDIWIKRDDMLGLFPGGNKTRKLEFLVADALVTCGAPQSNHCRITLAAAVKEGLKCRFAIEGRVPGSYDEDASGNHFMFRLKAAQAVADLLGIDLKIPRESVLSIGGYWKPKYSVPNAAMVEAVQLLARTEGIPLDPVYTGKIMAGLPSLRAYEREVLGKVPVAP